MAIEDTIKMIISDTVARAASPLGHLVLAAARRLRFDGDMPTGAKRKLSPEQAFLAMAVCTRMARVNRLLPSTVCKEAGVVEDASGTFRFMLTTKEMTESGELIEDAGPRQDISKSLGSYVWIVQAIARLTGSDELPLLEELGAAVADYLAPFDEAPLAAHDELATDLMALGAYFARERKGTDGEPIDLKEFFGMSRQMGVVYDPATNSMVVASDDPVDSFGHEPSVRLFMRRVAYGEGGCHRHERNPSGLPTYTSHELGRVRFRIDEVFSLAVVREGDKIRAVLVAEPWTTVLDKPGEPHTPFFKRSTYRWAQGVPLGGGILIGEGADRFSLSAGTDITYTCPFYERYIKELEGDGNGGIGNCLSGEVVCMPRRVEIDPEVLRTYLEDIYADGLRQMMDTTGASPPWAEGYVVPPTLTYPDGREANGLLDRLEDAFYGDGNAVFKALLEEATKRTRALDALVARTSTTRQVQKARFRRLMRS